MQQIKMAGSSLVETKFVLDYRPDKELRHSKRQIRRARLWKTEINDNSKKKVVGQGEDLSRATEVKSEHEKNSQGSVRTEALKVPCTNNTGSIWDHPSETKPTPDLRIRNSGAGAQHLRLYKLSRWFSYT